MTGLRVFRFGVLIGALACLVVFSKAAFAGDDVSSLTNQLNQCRKDVSDDRQAITNADDMLTLARSGKIVLVPIGVMGPELVPVDPNMMAQVLFLQYASHKISKGELKRQIKQIGEWGKSTVKNLNDYRAAAVDLRDEDENKCGGIAQQLKAAQQGTSSSAESNAGKLELVLTLEGATVVTDIKKQYQQPGANDPSVVRHLQSGKTYGGSVEIKGELPEGYSVYVWHPTGSNILLTTKTGGRFTGVTQPKGFGAQTGIGAYVCKYFGDSCSAQANISIQWIP